MSSVRTAHSVVVALLIACPATAALGQADAALAQLKSANIETRESGFYKLMGLANVGYVQTSGSLRPRCANMAKYAHGNPAVATAMIALLEHENHPEPSTSDRSENPYYGDLIGCVAALKDPRAVNGLLGAINTGFMAVGGLADLGPAALPGVLALLRTSRGNHLSAIQALEEMLKRWGPGIDRAAIESALIDALGSPNHPVRRSAVLALRSFSDPSLRRAIEAVAEKDSTYFVYSGKRAYPVRDAARAWLRHDDSLRTVKPPDLKVLVRLDQREA